MQLLREITQQLGMWFYQYLIFEAGTVCAT